VGITIEEAHDPARLTAIEDLQARAWGMPDRGIVPSSLMQIIGSGGGIVLAAYDRNDPAGGERPVGFVLGLLARREGRLYHASHMLATDPRYGGRGIGAALKRRQRELALAQGLDLMTWTFDPLIARNAYLNLHKLGATSRAYHEDYYGAMDDEANSGLPTDRLLVEWRLRDEPPALPPARAAPTPILTDEGGAPVLHIAGPPDGSPLYAQVPGDLGHLKERAADGGLAWRLALRRALSWAFAHGYVARDFVAGGYLLTPDDILTPATG